jgi:putative phosphoribosyl transferase
VILVRKLGVPFQPELAMGAIGEGGVRVLNEKVIAAAGVKANEFAAVEERERRELERRAARLRNGHVRTTVHGKTAVLVDDGMATGSTAFAACQVARRLGAVRVVLAVPVAPEVTVRIAEEVADEVVCLESPTPFFGVGEWYRDFSQVSDEEVMARCNGRSRVPRDQPCLAHAQPKITPRTAR